MTSPPRRFWPRRRVARWGLAGLVGVGGLAALFFGTACLSGCSSAGYLTQSATGHVELLRAARPVKVVIADPATPPALRERLQLTQRIRDFAVSDLHLPDNGSYRSYADLHRSAAVWNVVAAPELSLQLRTWCFPVVGCVGYRGYYSLAEAEAAAAPLRTEGLDVNVYPVPAYSTLGWMNWTGGDPLLNTFVNWPEIELSRLIFHELAHQVAYASGDTTFNESFATAVERLGSDRWLTGEEGERIKAAQRTREGRRADFLAIVKKYRERLDALYRGPASDDEKRRGKAEAFADMRAEFATLKRDRWEGFTGYDKWFAEANNASIGTQAAYDAKVEAFERLFHQQGDDFPRFYAEVQRMAALDRADREKALSACCGAPEAPATAASATPRP